MAFRRKCMKILMILGVIALTIQIIVSTRFHPIKVIHVQNSSSLTHRNLERSVVTVDSVTITTNETSPNQTRQETKPATEQLEHHDGHNGFELASSALSKCSSQRVQSPGPMNRVHVVLQKRLLYCPMEKIGTTFWRRLFYMLTSRSKAEFTTPYDVPIKTALDNTRLFTQAIQTAKSRNMLSDSFFSFLFVRNPYSRLLSAYIDKIVPPNPYYWKNLGGKAVSMFRPKQNIQKQSIRGRPVLKQVYPVAQDVTFAEFVKFATYTERTNRGVDPHILSTNKGCKPCTYPYKYIGKMETFKDDALFIMKQAGVNASMISLDEQFKLLSVYDAIEDSIESPFSWKKEILKSISWDKALRRIWLKLQMRGIISMDKPLDLSPERIDTITSKEFIELAKEAYRESDPTKLQKQKDLVKHEAFASVPLQDVIAFRDAFKEDFVLFGYDMSPAYIFNRTEHVVQPSLFFNYGHLN